MKKNYIIRSIPEALSNLIYDVLVNNLGADEMSEDNGLGKAQCYFLKDWALTSRTGPFINAVSIFAKDTANIEKRKSELEEHFKRKHKVYLGLEEK